MGAGGDVIAGAGVGGRRGLKGIFYRNPPKYGIPLGTTVGNVGGVGPMR